MGGDILRLCYTLSLENANSNGTSRHVHSERPWLLSNQRDEDEDAAHRGVDQANQDRPPFRVL